MAGTSSQSAQRCSGLTPSPGESLCSTRLRHGAGVEMGALACASPMGALPDAHVSVCVSLCLLFWFPLGLNPVRARELVATGRAATQRGCGAGGRRASRGVQLRATRHGCGAGRPGEGAIGAPAGGRQRGGHGQRGVHRQPRQRCGGGPLGGRRGSAGPRRPEAEG